MTRTSRAVLAGVGLFAITVFAATQPVQAGTVYLETFAGETSYSTTPEVDTLGLGGANGGGDGAGAPGAPTLTGAAASAVVTSVGGFAAQNETSGVGTAIGNVIDLGAPFTAAGSFSDFQVIPADATQATPYGAAGFAALMIYEADLSYTLGATLFAGDFGGTVVGFLSVGEVSGGTSLGFNELPVPGVVEGVPFDLELVVDPVSASAFARYTSGGITTSTATISLLALGANDPIVFAQFIGVRNFQGSDFGPGDRVRADLSNLRVDTVPEPSLLCLAGFALGALGLRRR